MHLFGCKFASERDGDTLPDRKNFDSLLWAIVTVFQVQQQALLTKHTLWVCKRGWGEEFRFAFHNALQSSIKLIAAGERNQNVSMRAGRRKRFLMIRDNKWRSDERGTPGDAKSCRREGSCRSSSKIVRSDRGVISMSKRTGLRARLTQVQ